MALVIAEAGSHYASNIPEKRLENAKFLARTAWHSGADYVKYQMYLDGGQDHFAPLRGDAGRRKHWEHCDMPFHEWVTLKKYCDDLGIKFMASAFQEKGVNWLRSLKPEYIKVASRCVKTFPYDMVEGFKLIVSDGMYDVPEIDGFVLQCTSDYPTPLEKARWERCDGLSDHSGTPWPAIDALARGAQVVEVHFWTDAWDRDRRSSVNRYELSLICQARNAFARMHADHGPKGKKEASR